MKYWCACAIMLGIICGMPWRSIGWLCCGTHNVDDDDMLWVLGLERDRLRPRRFLLCLPIAGQWAGQRPRQLAACNGFAETPWRARNAQGFTFARAHACWQTSWRTKLPSHADLCHRSQECISAAPQLRADEKHKTKENGSMTFPCTQSLREPIPQSQTFLLNLFCFLPSRQRSQTCISNREAHKPEALHGCSLE